MQLQNPLRAICPALEAEVLVALADGQARTPGVLVRRRGVSGSISGVRRCLERLNRNGVVEAGHSGNRVEYSLNTEHLLADLVIQASRALEHLIHSLSNEISRWEVQPVQVTLFGSAARGEMQVDSDIDLLFIVPDEASDRMYGLIGDAAIGAYRLTGNDVRPLVYDMSEVSPAPIFDSILRDGVHVFGDPRWLSCRLSSVGAG